MVHSDSVVWWCLGLATGEGHPQNRTISARTSFQSPLDFSQHDLDQLWYRRGLVTMAGNFYRTQVRQNTDPHVIGTFHQSIKDRGYRPRINLTLRAPNARAM